MAIIVKGGGGKPEEEKTVTAGTSVIEVLPSSGKTMKKVTVNPTPSQSKTVTPSTSQQTVSPDSGKLLSQVVVNAMTSGELSDITVSSAGLITAQVGTSGYLASGTSKTKQLTTQAAKTWTPGTSDQTISSGRYLTGSQTIKGDSDLIAENIREGIDIFGVLGTMVEGITPEMMGCTKIAVDKITFSIRTSVANVALTHSLGELPKFFILWSNNTGKVSEDVIYSAGAVAPNSYSNKMHGGTAYFSSSKPYITNVGSNNVDATTIKPANTNYYYTAGVEYTLITMA